MEKTLQSSSTGNPMKYAIMAVLLLIAACSNSGVNNSKLHSDTVSENYIILNSLLDIGEDKYTYVDASGKIQKDSLKIFKELERVYIKNVSPDLADGKFSASRLKIIMFYSFYSYEKKSAAFLEYLASDLMPIYEGNKDVFLDVLKEHPFLIEPNCNRLNAFFGFEGKNGDKKLSFVKNNSVIFRQRLNGGQYQLCMNSFDDKS